MKLKHLSTTIKRTAFTLLALSSTALIQAEEPAKHPVKPFLWKVEGPQLTKASYLFGTIHLGEPSVATLHPAAETAFNQADTVYTEINLSTESQLAMTPLLIRKDGKTLDESIGKDLAEQLNAELRIINPQLNSVPFQNLNTWLVASIPSLLPNQLKGLKALDLQLWEKAAAAGKKTAGLEEAEDQLKGFNTLTEPEQVIFMEEALKKMATDRAAGISQTQLLKAAYITGEIEEINTVINAAILEMKQSKHKELGEKIWQKLLTDRDVTISQSIIENLQSAPKKSHFFAVGTAHYCTDTSILFHLKKAGYTLTRIEK